MTATYPRGFEVAVSSCDQGPLVLVTGELDVFTGPRLQEQLQELIDNGVNTVTVDLGSLDFIDSTGLSVLVGALRQLRQHQGDLVLKAPSRWTYKLLETTGLTKIFVVL